MVMKICSAKYYAVLSIHLSTSYFVLLGRTFWQFAIDFSNQIYSVLVGKPTFKDMDMLYLDIVVWAKTLVVKNSCLFPGLLGSE